MVLYRITLESPHASTEVEHEKNKTKIKTSKCVGYKGTQSLKIPLMNTLKIWFIISSEIIANSKRTGCLTALCSKEKASLSLYGKCTQTWISYCSCSWEPVPWNSCSTHTIIYDCTVSSWHFLHITFALKRKVKPPEIHFFFMISLGVGHTLSVRELCNKPKALALFARSGFYNPPTVHTVGFPRDPRVAA